MVFGRVIITNSARRYNSLTMSVGESSLFAGV